MDLSESPTGRFRRHPWELARADFFVRELARSESVCAEARILDVGAGDAWISRQLAESLPESSITCWDSGYDKVTPPPAARVHYTTQPGDEQFDVCLLLDVAEHVKDDARFLRDVVAKLAPGGTLLFSVPAWPFLYSQHDRALRHFRRYRPAHAHALLESSGLTILRSGGLFHSLLIARALQVVVEKRRRKGHESAPEEPKAPDSLVWAGAAWTRSLVTSALKLDLTTGRLAARLGIPLPGLSWWASCRKDGA